MPPLALHTAIAKDIADRLKLAALDEERGSLYLGATAPDIRAITHWERSRTHFFDLDCFDEQSGVSALFAEYPTLANPGDLSPQTRAFVAGYLTHLVTDETWITTVYRPHFGERSPLGGDIRANIMDRALQFSLDAERRRDRHLMLHVLDAVTRTDMVLDIDLIDADTLRRWRDVIAEIVQNEPNWERFRQAAKRHLKIDADGDGVEDLMASLPDLVDETLTYLTSERVEAFMDDSLRGSLDAVRDFRENGDTAVRRYNEEIDGMTSAAAKMPLEVSRDEIEQARSQVDQSLVEALTIAADRIRAFYEPGTTAIYPSTVLMSVIPARVAGVQEVIMATPGTASGEVAPLKLVAADIAGVDRVFRAGGVQGIAAMAYGTETIPKVDKICGPGNIFVTLAKKRLLGEVGIDGIFGPSETVVIADEHADTSLVAADLLAGAEHDELATAVLLTDSPQLAESVSRLIDADVAALERSNVALTSLDARGGAVIVDSVEQAIDLANEFAPEHLCLRLRDADAAMQRVRSAGCVFVGARSVESIGDYTAGPSHVMPTGGSAAYASPLGVQDFLKVMSVVRLDQDTVNTIGPAAAAIARAEGLTGHARAVEGRLPRERS